MINVDTIPALTDHQRTELRKALSSRVGVLTGSAGTGKSFTIIKLLESLKHGSYAVCAPTGKAASRINEEMRIGAQTIHSMLGVERAGHDGDGWSFFYGRSNQLQRDLIICDEGPMVSTDLMASLLSAVRTGAQVLFTGDPNQLLPVGHGKPVKDMIDSGIISHGHLTEIHRYAGRIARVANAVKDGNAWTPSTKIDLEAEAAENYCHVESTAARQTKDAICKLVAMLIAKGHDPFEDIQILCAMNERGDLSRVDLNELLQEQINSSGIIKAKCPFRGGDRVMCLKNGLRNCYEWDGSQYVESGSGVYVANGEQGTVVAFSETKNGNCNGVYMRFLGEIIKVTPGMYSMFCTSYACTVHKMQGSGAKAVIVVIDDAGSRVTSRQWFYTSITRAMKVCFTVGRMNTIRAMCRVNGVDNRLTFLAERLREGGPLPVSFAARTGVM